MYHQSRKVRSKKIPRFRHKNRNETSFNLQKRVILKLTPSQFKRDLDKELKSIRNSQIETKKPRFNSNSKSKGNLKTCKKTLLWLTRITSGEPKTCSSAREIFSKLLQILQTSSTTITLTTSLLLTHRRLHHRHSSYLSSPRVRRSQHLLKVSSKLESRLPTKFSRKGQISTALSFKLIRAAWEVKGQKTKRNSIAKTHF